MSVVFVSMMVSKDENIIRPVEPVMKILMEKMDAVDKINFKLKRIYFFLISSMLIQC